MGLGAKVVDVVANVWVAENRHRQGLWLGGSLELRERWRGRKITS
jgi:hypothetical protein